MTILDDLLGDRVLLATSHSDNVVLSYKAGESWQGIPLNQARGIAMNESSIAIAGQDGVFLYSPSTGAFVSMFVPVDHSTHELAFTSAGLLACSPSRSSLTQYAITGGTDVWTIPGVDVGTTDGRSWINGVVVSGDKPAYVTTLGVSNTPDGWRAEAAASRGALIDVQANQIVLQDLLFPHTPTIQPDGSVLFLNSGHGQVCKWTPGDSSFTVIVELGGWARGLTMLDSTHAIVGVSQGRLTAIPDLTVDPMASPGLRLVDLSTGSVVQEMPVDVREIFDLAVAGVRLA